jgi:PST family polysaccharide transporter
MIISFAIGLPFGPIGVAIGYSVSGILIQLPVTFHVAGRRGPVSTTDLWFAFLRHLPVCLVVLGVTWLIASSGIASSPLTELIVSAGLGLLAGAGVAFLYPPSRRTATQLLGLFKRP